MSPRVLEPSREELEERRHRLLERLAMTREEAQAAAAAGVLVGDQLWLWEDLRSIEFLLGQDGDA
jgi:hypothetical protein